MLVVHVHVRVKAGQEDAFVAATIANAEASLGEPGVLRFDVIREEGAADRFVLVEVYRGADDAAAHKQTAHYATWRDAVEPMMAEPRRSTKYVEVVPREARGWSSTGKA